MNERGGGKTKVIQSSPPPAPSAADAINAWVSSMPRVFETQLRYAPLEAAQEVALAQQYAAPMGQAYRAAQEQMYPDESALSRGLTQQAQAGMTSEVPDWMKQEYISNRNAQLGTNVGSPIAADYMSTGLMQQKQDWQNYYRNLGLSIAGRQPVFQATTPQTSNYMAGWTPNAVGAQMGQNYGNYVGAYASMYGANAQMAAQQSANRAQMFGSGIGALGAIGGGMFGLGGMFGKPLK